MTTKELLLQEIDQVPEPILEEVLEFLRSLKTKQPANSERSDVWNAYLASKLEREEVYRRLANS